MNSMSSGATAMAKQIEADLKRSKKSGKMCPKNEPTRGDVDAEFGDSVFFALHAFNRVHRRADS
jgi:hypothetical protein